MKRIVNFSAMALAMALLTGCGGSDEPAGENGDATGSGNLEFQNRGDSIATIDPSATTPDELSAEAMRLENEGRFAEAAEVWEAIATEVAANMGDKSWQIVDPKYNAHIAQLQSEFDDAQLQQLQRLHFLKQQAENPDTSSAESIISIEEMIVVAETLFGEEAPIVGKLNCQLAGIRQTAGDMDGASSNYHAGIDILREKYCPIHPEIVAAQSALANCYLEMGEFRTAIANLKASTSMAAQLFGEESLQYARQANQLGVAYYRGGDLDTAEQILKGAEAIRRQSLGEEHLLVGHSLLNVGIVMLDQRDYSSAVHCLERAESIFAGSTETSSELLFKSRNKLATVYMLIQQPDLAEPLLTLLIESRKAEFGDDHPDVAMFEFRYGIALARQGKYELAEPAFVHALEVQEEQLGLNNRETIKTIQAYAMLLARTGREDEAKAQAERIIRVASRPEGADSTIRKP